MRLFIIHRKGEVVQNGKNKARYKLKCNKCRHINFYSRDCVITEEKASYIICENCNRRIELKKNK